MRKLRKRVVLLSCVACLFLAANVLLSLNQRLISRRQDLMKAILMKANDQKMLYTKRPVSVTQSSADDMAFNKTDAIHEQPTNETNEESPQDINDAADNEEGQTADGEDVVLRLGVPRKTKSFLTIGLCTVPRKGAYYLLDTLRSLLKKLSTDEKKDVVIVIYLGSLSESWAMNTTNDINSTFHQDILAGNIIVIQPKEHIYPAFGNITKRTFNDSLKRVHWRTKQNIDFAHLFSYSKNISEYYLHIEDDVITATNFFTNIKSTISKNRKTNWFCIEFSNLGFIGKLFHAHDLQTISYFLLLFKTDWPCDHLLKHLKTIMLQSKDIKSPVSLFQHRGLVSSLENKTQKLIDKGFKDVNALRQELPAEDIKRPSLPTDIRVTNPNGKITTNLTHHRGYPPLKAFSSSTKDYLWALAPKKGSFFNIELDQPTNLSRVLVSTGHPEKRHDKLIHGEIEFRNSTNDGFCGELIKTAVFVNGTVDIDMVTSIFAANIKCVSIVVTATQSDWMILNKIILK